MHSLSSRIQAISNATLSSVSAISVTVAILLIIQLFFSGTWNIDSASIGRVKAQGLVKNLRVFGAEPGFPRENQKLQFDLSADLTPLFNYNTKQVFVYLTAEYEGANSTENKVIFWDKIIVSKENAVINLKNVRSKYSVWDVEQSFRERQGILKLEWNIQPWVGPLLFGSTDTETSVKFAPIKKSKKVRK